MRLFRNYVTARVARMGGQCCGDRMDMDPRQKNPALQVSLAKKYPALQQNVLNFYRTTSFGRCHPLSIQAVGNREAEFQYKI